jgi:predicted DsbA family dithiol-disulfide isomerase
MADFIDGHGASRQQFLDAFNSQEVRRALRDADVEQRALVINTVPTLVVADRYVVNMDFGRKLALDIMDFLIAKELAAQSEQTATQ